jgi:hypothetical protein
MERTKVLQRLYLFEKHPELYKELSTQELATFVRVVLSQVEAIDKAIKEHRLDGYTPQPGKDYLSRREAENQLKTLFSGASESFSKEQQAALDRITERLQNLRDGEDGKSPIITDELVQEIAQEAALYVTLPEFTALITQEPEAIRDALELLQGEDRLSIDYIDGIEELKRELRSHSDSNTHRVGATIARKLGQIGDVNVESATTGQALVKQADGTWRGATVSGAGIAIETPGGDVDGTNDTVTVTAEPKWVVSDGIMYFDGAGYTYAALSITMDVPPSLSIRAII